MPSTKRYSYVAYSDNDGLVGVSNTPFMDDLNHICGSLLSLNTGDGVEKLRDKLGGLCTSNYGRANEYLARRHGRRHGSGRRHGRRNKH
jgi:hypothetical protein